MFVSLVLLVASLVVLAVGAELLVRGAVVIAKGLGVSSFFIGLTIVGFGTSTPELATGLNAALNGLSDINMGNVVGSNIFNIALILGITAVLSPIPVNTRVVRGEVWIVILTSFIPFLAVFTSGRITRAEGLFMLAGLIVYLVRGYRLGRAESESIGESVEQEIEAELAVAASGWKNHVLVNLGIVVVGLVLLVFGSDLLVGSSVAIARMIGVSELVIALTIVAAGTSSPELVTSLVAAYRKQSDISVGNILGSNIFNILGILGITCTIQPQHVSPQVLWVDTPLMIALSIACLPIMMSHHRISRLEGFVLLAAYVVYLIALFTVAPAWFPARSVG